MYWKLYNTLKKYNIDYKCVESCEKFHNNGEYECVENLAGTTFKYESIIDNTCYQDWKKLSPIFYFNKDKNKCFTNYSNYI